MTHPPTSSHPKEYYKKNHTTTSGIILDIAQVEVTSIISSMHPNPPSPTPTHPVDFMTHHPQPYGFHDPPIPPHPKEYYKKNHITFGTILDMAQVEVTSIISDTLPHPIPPHHTPPHPNPTHTTPYQTQNILGTSLDSMGSFTVSHFW